MLAEAQQVPAKKASKAQKRREKDEHERQVRERELARVSESGSQPQSAEDFERLVMGDPNSSMVWIQYMAFLISLGEVEKARGIAERGLATVNYRFVFYRHGQRVGAAECCIVRAHAPGRLSHTYASYTEVKHDGNA